MSTNKKVLVLGGICLVLVFMTGCATTPAVEKNNMDVVQRIFHEAWNQKKLDVIDEVLSPDYVKHDVFGPEIRGPEAYKQFVGMFLDAFPDVQFKVEDVFSEGDKVVLRWSTTATHKGELMGIPPSGNEAGTTGLIIYRMSGGKIVEEWVNWNTLGLLQKIGVIPPLE